MYATVQCEFRYISRNLVAAVVARRRALGGSGGAGPVGGCGCGPVGRRVVGARAAVCRVGGRRGGGGGGLWAATRGGPVGRRRVGARACACGGASALTKLPNGRTFRLGCVGGGGPTVLLLVGLFWALWGFRWALHLRWRALGTVGRFPYGAEDVILTRLRARTKLPGHIPAVRDEKFSNYKRCAATVKGRSAFAKIKTPY